MLDLIRADTVSTLKNKSVMLLMLFFPVLNVTVGLIDAFKAGRALNHDCFFEALSYLGMTAAYFTSVTFGNDITSGTIRPKLTAGKSRTAVYMSRLIVTAVFHAAAVILPVPVMLAAGMVTGCKVTASASSVALTLLCAFIAAYALSAFYMLVNVIIRHQTKATACGVCMAFIMNMVGYVVVLGGDKEAFVIGRFTLPSGYIKMIMNMDKFKIPALPTPVYMLAFSVVLTFIGIIIAKRADFK